MKTKNGLTDKTKEDVMKKIFSLLAIMVIVLASPAWGDGFIIVEPIHPYPYPHPPHPMPPPPSPSIKG